MITIDFVSLKFFKVYNGCILSSENKSSKSVMKKFAAHGSPRPCFFAKPNVENLALLFSSFSLKHINGK